MKFSMDSSDLCEVDFKMFCDGLVTEIVRYLFVSRISVMVFIVCMIPLFRE